MPDRGLGRAVPEDARRAAQLAKADLVSGMVGEFPELQGLMGRYYAEAGGTKPEIARAIELHYKPKGPTDTVPRVEEGDAVAVAVALADKLDTLVGFWAIGEKPTGRGDPYQLRRAALGVIRIVLENDLRLPLCREAFAPSVTARVDEYARMQRLPKPRLAARAACRVETRWEILKGSTRRQFYDDLLAFFADRLKVHLREKGARHDLIDAVFSLGGQDDLALIVKRVEALGEFLKTDDGANLLAGVKRATNILRDRGEEGQDEPRRRRRSRAAARAAGNGALRGDREGEEGHGRRHQRRELRRRHAGAGRAARAGRRVLRQGDGERAPTPALRANRLRCSPRSAPPPSTSPTSPRSRGDVIPGLVPGIHLAACLGVCRWLDPGDEHRDDLTQCGRGSA